MADLVFEGRRRPLVAGCSLFDEADELAIAVPSSCRRSGRCHECVVAVPRGEDLLCQRSAAEDFLPHGFRLACQALVERIDTDVEFSVLRRRLRMLLPPAGTAYALDPLVARVGDEVRYGNVPIDHYRGRLLGLALDVGTTTVVAELVDLEAGRPVHAAAFENPQRFGGSDVMTRIAYEGEHPGELRRALRRALNRVLREAYATLGVERQMVYEAVIVGNPTMRDLFFGLDVAPLGCSPYRSASEEAERAGHAQTTSLTRLAHELGVFIHPQARVWGAPLIASHVGADTAADLVATDLAAQRGICMLVDIGTNSEIVIGDGRRFLAASCPAGPAFEGGLIRHGMAGADGAIESAVWRDGGFFCRTVGDAPPEGICGSGLVDLLAESRRVGLLSVQATLPAGAASIPVVPDAGIDLSRADLSALALAKSANATGQRILLRRFGVTPVELDRVYLAGAFANALDVRQAIAIGLLAPVPEERVMRVGNASVQGAAALLCSDRARAALEQLARRIEHVELEAEADFFELFVDGCRLEPWRPAAPHGSPREWARETR